MNVVAYGSLMHRPSLEATLRRPARLNRITVPGWRRVFDAAFTDGLAYLNLRPALSTQIPGHRPRPGNDLARRDTERLR